MILFEYFVIIHPINRTQAALTDDYVKAAVFVEIVFDLSIKKLLVLVYECIVKIRYTICVPCIDIQYF